MKRLLRPLFAISLVLVVASACGSDSTGPTSAQQAAALAAHFDSLYTAAANASQSSNDGFATRASVVGFVEVGAAFGVLPSPVTVTTANGTESWKAFQLEDVLYSGSTPIDSIYLLLAYRESAAHTVAFAYYDSTGSFSNRAGILTNDTLAVQVSAGSGVTHVLSAGSACVPPTGLNDVTVTNLLGSGCNIAKFSSSLSLTASPAATYDPALTSLFFDATTIAGVRFTEMPNQASRVRALLTHFGIPVPAAVRR